MKKTVLLCLLVCAAFLSGCRHQEAPYDRSDYKNEYARLMRTHIFAACQWPNQPYAVYSLAKVNRKPTDRDPRYKVTFFNGPCEGRTVLTKDVLTKTSSASGAAFPKGTVVLRNYYNPKKPYDTEHTDRWNKGVVYDTSHLEEGYIGLEFPRDKNDFMAARENIWLHNVRLIVKPEVKDVRIWL